MAGDHIVPPIVVGEGRDLTFHRSTGDVVGYYEPWFPTSATYRAFDADGRRLELVATPPVVQRRLSGRSRTDNAHESSLEIRAIETNPGGVAELADLLREWLRHAGKLDDSDQRLTLRELLDRAVEHAGFT